MKQVQDFYKATITQDWSIGTGIFYVSVKPTITEGWLYVSPNNPALREQIYYNGVGTDGNGDYITVTQRGMGTTDEQTHTIGEPIRMNIGEGYVKYLTDAIEDIVAAGTPDADTSTAGKVEIATDAQVIAGTDTGETGAKLVATPGQIKTNYEKIVPIVRTYLNAASPATWTKPAGLKYVVVEVQAGGGGGGGADSDSSSGYYEAGGGGGGGGYSKKTITAATLGSTETVTIGAGGAGGTTGTTGGTGETSSFGSHSIATGGSGGYRSDASGYYGAGALGGVGSSGDINIYGNSGETGDGSLSGNGGGMGGNSFLGSGGRNSDNADSKGLYGTGDSGIIYGGGGGGAFSVYGGSYAGDKTGGAGAAGIVIVTEFY